MHLIIEGYGCDIQKIRDTNLIYEFLDSCPDQIKMTKVSTPQVFTYEGPSPGETGVSGFVLLAESHISIHIPPGQSSLTLDLFSCKQFKTEDAVKLLQERLGIKGMRSYLLNRPESGIEVSSY